jgi:hypothetical protein
VEVEVKESEWIVFPDIVCPTESDVIEIPTNAPLEPVPVVVLCVERFLTVLLFIVSVPNVALIPFVNPVDVQLLFMLATVLLLTDVGVPVAGPEVIAMPVKATLMAPVEV